MYASTPLTILIKSNYCINDEIHLKASFFGYNDTKETANIVIIPKDRSQFVVPSQHILSAFQDKNVACRMLEMSAQAWSLLNATVI